MILRKDRVIIGYISALKVIHLQIFVDNEYLYRIQYLVHSRKLYVVDYEPVLGLHICQYTAFNCISFFFF